MIGISHAHSFGSPYIASTPSANAAITAPISAAINDLAICSPNPGPIMVNLL